MTGKLQASRPQTTQKPPRTFPGGAPVAMGMTLASATLCAAVGPDVVLETLDHLRHQMAPFRIGSFHQSAFYEAKAWGLFAGLSGVAIYGREALRAAAIGRKPAQGASLIEQTDS